MVGEQCGVVNDERLGVACHRPRSLLDHERLEVMGQAGQQLFCDEHRLAATVGGRHERVRGRRVTDDQQVPAGLSRLVPRGSWRL